MKNDCSPYFCDGKYETEPASPRRAKIKRLFEMTDCG